MRVWALSGPAFWTCRGTDWPLSPPARFRFADGPGPNAKNFMKIQNFNKRLKNPNPVAEGPMGPMLNEGVGSQRCFDEVNSTEPEAVFRVHQAYIEAGAQIIETNTFGANRFKLAPLGLGEEVQRLNSRGVKIAREARESASREVLIAGSIGPLGVGVQSRHPSPEEIQDVFHEQAPPPQEPRAASYILQTFASIR